MKIKKYLKIALAALLIFIFAVMITAFILNFLDYFNYPVFITLRNFLNLTTAKFKKLPLVLVWPALIIFAIVVLLPEKSKTHTREHTQKRMITTEEITLIAMLTALITIAKQAIYFIANVEFVTLLLIITVAVFGVKIGFITSLMFSLIQTVLYGISVFSLGYFILWPLLVILTVVLFRFIKSEYAVAVLAGLFGLLFDVPYAIFWYFKFGFNFAVTYLFVSGGYYSIIHCVSNFILVLLLFKALEKTFFSAAKQAGFKTKESLPKHKEIIEAA